MIRALLLHIFEMKKLSKYDSDNEVINEANELSC